MLPTRGFPPPSLPGKAPKRQLSLALNSLTLHRQHHRLTEDRQKPLHKEEPQDWSRPRRPHGCGQISIPESPPRGESPSLPPTHPPIRREGLTLAAFTGLALYINSSLSLEIQKGRLTKHLAPELLLGVGNTAVKGKKRRPSWNLNSLQKGRRLERRLCVVISLSPI